MRLTSFIEFGESNKAREAQQISARGSSGTFVVGFLLVFIITLFFIIFCCF